MADWADDIAYQLGDECEIGGEGWRIAAALRQARADALEEAAKVAETCRKGTEAANIRALKDKP
jgi:hypothetical protein